MSFKASAFTAGNQQKTHIFWEGAYQQCSHVANVVMTSLLVVPKVMTLGCQQCQTASISGESQGMGHLLPAAGTWKPYFCLIWIQFLFFYLCLLAAGCLQIPFFKKLNQPKVLLYVYGFRGRIFHELMIILPVTAIHVRNT